MHGAGHSSDLNYDYIIDLEIFDVIIILNFGDMVDFTKVHLFLLDGKIDDSKNFRCLGSTLTKKCLASSIIIYDIFPLNLNLAGSGVKPAKPIL